MKDSMYQTAAHWQLRLESGPLGADDEAALSTWLAADERHPIALAEAGIAWHGSANAHPDAAAAHRGATLRRAARVSRWQAWTAGALAAPVLLLALAFAPGWWATLRADARTGVGEVREFTLDDGSRAVLDSDSAIAIAYSADARSIRVLRGAAWFEVRPDAARPFRVTASGITATAVGTAYAVDSTQAAVDVAVTHGVVEVETEHGGSLARLAAGMRLRTDGAAAQPQQMDAQAQAALAWREQVLSFEHERLDHALDRLDRYLPERVLLLDEQSAGQVVSAVFPLADARLAVDALARSHGLQVRRLPGLIIVGG
jgi:transmembrane sensor